MPLPSGAVARARFSTRADGDLRVTGDADDLAARRSALVDLPWVWLHQVHSAEVVTVSDAAAAARHAGAEADALVARVPGVVLAAHAADCAPLALVSPEGVVGAVHAGWRGTTAGVVQAAAAAMRALGAERIDAALYPCIHVECCEFGPGDLDAVAERLGSGVRGTTASGRPALDLPAAVAAALDEAGVGLARVVDECTSCDPARRLWSHRSRGDRQRHALAVWIEEPG